MSLSPPSSLPPSRPMSCTFDRRKSRNDASTLPRKRTVGALKRSRPLPF